jgi:hypothetical protein
VALRSVAFVTVMRLFNTYFFSVATEYNIRHTFGAWIHNMNAGKRKFFLVGIGAMLWVIWLSQNDIEFDKTPVLPFMQVIYRGTHWTRT